jgi:hypothetical protein
MSLLQFRGKIEILRMRDLFPRLFRLLVICKLASDPCNNCGHRHV